MKLTSPSLLLTITLTLGVGIGRATPVIPGGTVFNDLFFASQDVTLLASNSGNWSSGSGSATATGTYTDAVYRNTSGTLDFVYQFSNSSSSSVAITSTTGYNFGNFTTDVGYVQNGAALPGGIFMNGSTITPGVPDDISRSGDGSTITFDFNVFGTGDNIGAGITTAALMVSTNATKFTSGAVGLIAAGTDNLAGFQPTAVPEPSTLVPLGGLSLLLGGMVAIKRRKRRAV
jgi:hypothetical protein